MHRVVVSSPSTLPRVLNYPSMGRFEQRVEEEEDNVVTTVPTVTACAPRDNNRASLAPFFLPMSSSPELPVGPTSTCLPLTLRSSDASLPTSALSMTTSPSTLRPSLLQLPLLTLTPPQALPAAHTVRPIASRIAALPPPSPSPSAKLWPARSRLKRARLPLARRPALLHQVPLLVHLALLLPAPCSITTGAGEVTNPAAGTVYTCRACTRVWSARVFRSVVA